MKRRVLRIAFVCFTATIVTANETNYGPLIPVLQQDLHMSGEQLAMLLATSFFVGMVGAGLLGGALADRYEARTVMLGSLFLLIGGQLLLPFPLAPVGHAIWMSAMRVLAGIGTGMMFVSGARIMATMGSLAGIAQGFYGSANVLGPALGLLLTPLMLTITSWQGTFLLWGAGGMVAALFWVWMDDVLPVLSHPHQEGKPLGVLRVRALWMLGLTFMSTASLGNAIFSWLAVYFLTRYNVSLVLAGLLGSLGLIGSIGCRPLGGMLLARLSPLWLIRISTMLSVLGVGLLALPIPSLPLACTGMLLLSFGMGMPHAAIFNLAAKVGNISKFGAGLAQGVILMAGAPALFFASPLIGWLLTHLGNFTFAFGLVGLSFGGIGVAASLLAGPLLARHPEAHKFSL